MQAINSLGAYPTAANAHERDKMNTHRVAGKARVVKHRVKAVDEHDDDRGGTVSSLVGQQELQDSVWTDARGEEVGQLNFAHPGHHHCQRTPALHNGWAHADPALLFGR